MKYSNCFFAFSCTTQDVFGVHSRCFFLLRMPKILLRMPCFLTQDACFLTQDAIFRLTMHQVKVHVHEEILCTPGSFALGVFLVVFGV
jgi:hypothetical protein